MAKYLRHIIILMAVGLVVLMPCCALQYQIQPLGTLGAGFDRARAVNAAGEVVGEALIPVQGSVERAFLWNSGNMTDLGTLGGMRSRALDVNACGYVAGWAVDANGLTYATCWDDAGGVHPLPTLGGLSGTAWAINDNGAVVGSACLSNGLSHAALWSDAGVWDLGTLGGNYSTAYDINLSGEIAGSAYDSSGKQRACVWTDDGILNLGNLSGGSWNTARGINDSGEMIFWGTPTGASANHATLWSGIAGDSVLDLGTFGGDESWAYGLNNLGQVVGWAEDHYGFYRAFVYDGTDMVDLGTLGGSFSSAYGINDDGVIVGYAQDTLGAWQAVRWVPVPEPSSMVTLLAALAAGATAVRRRNKNRRAVAHPSSLCQERHEVV